MKQLVLVLLGASAAYVGGWALFAPESFYRSFPGLGMHWVSADGPYNEHLIRDVGGLYLALLVMSCWAAMSTPIAQRIAGAGWLVFGISHFTYHLAHLDRLSTTSAWLQSVALGLTVVGAIVVVLPITDR